MIADLSSHPTAGEIVLVEDDPISLELMTVVLADSGYRVHPAVDGESALRTVQIRLPDLVLLDITLPKINGVEVCRRLKADPATRKIPVIFTSAIGSTELKAKILAAGAVDGVAKPVDTDQLLAKIEIHIKRYRLNQTEGRPS